MKFFFATLLFTAQLLSHEIERERLLTLFSGEWVSRALYVATKLEIADHLTEPKSTKELAIITQTNPESLKRLMRALTSFGLFQEVSPNVFMNTEMGALLTKNHPDSLYALSLFYGEDIHDSWDSLLESVETGKPAFELTFEKPVFQYFKENPIKRSLFQEAMREKSRAVIQSALANYDFTQFSTLYDIGGGQGQFLEMLAEKAPQIQGTLFELPEVISELKGRDFTMIAGDFFSKIPSGGDAYLLKSVLHDWDSSQCKKILDNCYQAMGVNSRLLIMDVVLQPEARYAHSMDLLMLAVTGGKERSLKDFKEMLEKSGFTIENVYPTATEFSLIEAKKTDTLTTYEASVQEYVDGTATDVTGVTKTWIDKTLSLLPQEARILEVGSAFGRDAHYIESKGYRLERTDATQGFVDLLKNRGYTARLLNILTDPIEGSYDLLFANAVFLHFRIEELEIVIKKIHQALNSEGLLSFSVKHGEGEEWSSSKVGRPRFFHYWQKDSIITFLKNHGFEVLELSEDQIFTYIIAKKT